MPRVLVAAYYINPLTRGVPTCQCRVRSAEHLLEACKQTRLVGTGTTPQHGWGPRHWLLDPYCHLIDGYRTVQCPYEAGVLLHRSFGYRHTKYADVIATHRRA